MPPEFKKIEQRDAYAVIRGFMYQVQTTVRAWVQLPDDELLELESGEDIDWLKVVNTESQAERERLLGQTKFRSRPLRIRSPEALMSLFHFYQHRRNNPGFQLRFRYMTNAPSGSDRVPHSSGLSAIELWEALRKGEVEENKRSDATKFICDLLSSTTKPTDANTGEWGNFKSFFKESPIEAVLGFLERFEWGLGNAALKDQRLEIEALLQSRSEVGSATEARAAFAHLSTIVTEKLSTSGIKQLSAHDCHAALIASKTLALDTTYQGFSTLSEKLEHTATRLEAASTGFEQLGKLGAAGLAHFGSEVDEIPFGTPELLIEPPSLVEPHAARAVVVNALEQSLRSVVGWCLLVIAELPRAR
jgi:hypothetical protein